MKKKIENLMNLHVWGATSDVGVMSGMYDIGA